MSRHAAGRRGEGGRGFDQRGGDGLSGRAAGDGRAGGAASDRVGNAHRRVRAYIRRGADGPTRIRALLSLGMILGLGAVGTLAAWTDNATATTGTFSTATVELKVDGADSYTVSGLAMTDMLPGESVAKTVTVENHSPIAIAYAAKAEPKATSPSMADHLYTRVYASGSATNSPVAGYRTGTCGGSELTNGETTLSTTGQVNLYGGQLLNPENDTGDTQDICIIIGLDDTADTANSSGQTVDSVTFTFTGSPPLT